MKKHNLGEFEEIVLLTVGVLHGEAYGVSIKKEIETRGDRKVSVGALQTALIRLEKKNQIFCLLQRPIGTRNIGYSNRDLTILTINGYWIS